MGSYPDDWPQIAKAVKDEADWMCEREDCKAQHASGYVLTVHHLDGDSMNNARENLIALCQRCHLKEQNAAWRQRQAEKREGVEQVRMF